MLLCCFDGLPNSVTTDRCFAAADVAVLSTSLCSTRLVACVFRMAAVNLYATLLYRISARFRFCSFVNNTARAEGLSALSSGSGSLCLPLPLFVSLLPTPIVIDGRCGVPFQRRAEGGAIFATGSIALQIGGYALTLHL